MDEEWEYYAELCPTYIIENLRLMEKTNILLDGPLDKRGRKKGLSYNIKRKIKEKND